MTFGLTFRFGMEIPAVGGELKKGVENLEAKFGEENFTLRVMLELLKV
jgi:hypothetical protein